jgi:hypothetical protein
MSGKSDQEQYPPSPVSQPDQFTLSQLKEMFAAEQGKAPQQPRFVRKYDEYTGEEVLQVNPAANFRVTGASGQPIVDQRAQNRRIEALQELARIREEERQMAQLQANGVSASGVSAPAESLEVKDLKEKVAQLEKMTQQQRAAEAAPVVAEASKASAVADGDDEDHKAMYAKFIADRKQAKEEERIAKIVEARIAKMEAEKAAAAPAQAQAVQKVAESKRKETPAVDAADTYFDADEEDDDAKTNADGVSAEDIANTQFAKKSKHENGLNSTLDMIRQKFVDFRDRYNQLKSDKNSFALNRHKMDPETAVKREAKLALREAKLNNEKNGVLGWAVDETLKIQKETGGKIGAGLENMFAAYQARTNINLEDIDNTQNALVAVASSAYNYMQSARTLGDVERELQREREISAAKDIALKRQQMGLDVEKTMQRIDPVARQAAASASASTPAPMSVDSKIPRAGINTTDRPSWLDFKTTNQYVAVASSRGSPGYQDTDDSGKPMAVWQQKPVSLKNVRIMFNRATHLKNGKKELEIMFGDQNSKAPVKPMRELIGLHNDGDPRHRAVFENLLQYRDAACGVKGMPTCLPSDYFGEGEAYEPVEDGVL